MKQYIAIALYHKWQENPLPFGPFADIAKAVEWTNKQDNVNAKWYITRIQSVADVKATEPCDYIQLLDAYNRIKDNEKNLLIAIEIKEKIQEAKGYADSQVREYHCCATVQEQIDWNKQFTFAIGRLVSDYMSEPCANWFIQLGVKPIADQPKAVKGS